MGGQVEINTVIIIIIITRPWPAFGRHGLAGSSGGDQSGRINSSYSIIEELARFARSDWMGMSGGDQSGRINSSHSMGFIKKKIIPLLIIFPPAKIIFPPAK